MNPLRLFRKTVLKRIAGRDQPVWRALPLPRLRHALFRDDLDTLIHGLIASRSRVRFIQIGSNDGIVCDPLWTFRRFPNWSGILVEPVEDLFQMLVANYAPWANRFVLENAAITREPRPFHFIARADESLGRLYRLFGSFDRELLELNAGRFGVASAQLVTLDVKCLTFQQLCEKHNVQSLDLLHIDAEGCDAEILQQVDFDRFKPSIVLYEHVNLAGADGQEVEQRLDAHDYLRIQIGIDTLAVRSASLRSMPTLRAAWRTIRRGAS
jgi:FkbM family methyltransferase